MLVFSERLKIVKLFNIWRMKDNLAPTGANMLVFLALNGLLDEEAARAIINSKENVNLVHEEE